MESDCQYLVVKRSGVQLFFLVGDEDLPVARTISRDSDEVASPVVGLETPHREDFGLPHNCDLL